MNGMHKNARELKLNLQKLAPIHCKPKTYQPTYVLFRTMRKKIKAVFRSESPSPSRREGAARSRTAKGVLTTTLAMADSALDGLPIYGPKAAVKFTLEVLKAVDICVFDRADLCNMLRYIGYSHKTSQNEETLRDLQSHLEMLINSVLEPVNKMFDVPQTLQDEVDALARYLHPSVTLAYLGMEIFNMLVIISQKTQRICRRMGGEEKVGWTEKVL